MKTLKMTIVFVMALTLMGLPAMAAEGSASVSDAKKPVALKVGDKAPDFALPKGLLAGEKAPKKLSDFLGKENVLLAFYPKAFTGGCTTQLCGYRDEFAIFKNSDTQVIAISTDVQKESDRFKLEYKFPFAVMGDTNAKTIDLYGIAKRESKNGGFVAARSVILIDKKGVIRHIDHNYSIKEDTKPLYEMISKLAAPAEGSGSSTKSSNDT